MLRGLWRRLRFSLSARLMLLFLVTAVALALILGSAVRVATRHYFAQVIGPHAEQYLSYIRAEIGHPPEVDKARALARRLPVQIVLRGPEINWSSDASGRDIETLRYRRPRRGRGLSYAVADDADRFALRTQIGRHRLYLSIPQHGRRGGGWRALVASVGAIGGMLLTLYLCYRAIRRLFAPVQTIRRGVGRIGAGELAHRIRLRRRDELGELAASINAMADEIEKMLDAKRQLLLAISHELRSPLTRANVSLELLEDSEEQRAIKRDLSEMERMIADILETERLSGGHQPLTLAETDLNRLASLLLAEQFAGVDIVFEPLAEDLTVSADPARLRLLLKNLLDNAVRYGGAAPPRLRLTRAGGKIHLSVSDSGTGIAAEHLKRLTEPFYRPDPSRQRRTGGFGLGLYLCRAIAEAHGGRLLIDSGRGRGTTVTVELPG